MYPPTLWKEILYGTETPYKIETSFPQMVSMIVWKDRGKEKKSRRWMDYVVREKRDRDQDHVLHSREWPRDQLEKIACKALSCMSCRVLSLSLFVRFHLEHLNYVYSVAKVLYSFHCSQITTEMQSRYLCI